MGGRVRLEVGMVRVSERGTRAGAETVRLKERDRDRDGQRHRDTDT